MGLGALNPTASIPYPIVPMFVETFGGGVYHVCDGGDTFGFGEQSRVIQAGIRTPVSSYSIPSYSILT